MLKNMFKYLYFAGIMQRVCFNMQKIVQPIPIAIKTNSAGNGTNGNKKEIFPPAKVIENFTRDIQSGMGKISKARETPGFKGFVTVFGSARLKPLDNDYELAAATGYDLGKHGYGTITGGGPGIMQAANEGALAAKAQSIGIQPSFLRAQETGINNNKKIQHYVKSMYSRKILFSANSSAIIAFPGGFGTLDELFENLTLIQIGKMKGVQVILMGSEKYWKSLTKWLENQSVGRGFINAQEYGLIKYAQNPKEALKIIRQKTFKPVRHDPGKLAEMFAHDLRICHEYIGMLSQNSASIFGSARITGGEFYKSAKKVAKRLSNMGYAIYSGGGSGIMEAVADGVLEAGKKSYGLIPVFFMAKENPDLTKTIHVPMNMMTSRKLVLGSSNALVFYPGGYGTLDELFEYTVRIQIGDLERVPVITVHKQFWEPLNHWIQKYPLDMGLIAQKDMDIIKMANTPREAIRLIENKGEI